MRHQFHICYLHKINNTTGFPRLILKYDYLQSTEPYSNFNLNNIKHSPAIIAPVLFPRNSILIGQFSIKSCCGKPSSKISEYPFKQNENMLIQICWYYTYFHYNSLKVQSCKLYNNKYMITPTKITNTEIFASSAVLVFKLFSSKVLFTNWKDNRNC